MLALLVVATPLPAMEPRDGESGRPGECGDNVGEIPEEAVLWEVWEVVLDSLLLLLKVRPVVTRKDKPVPVVGSVDNSCGREVSIISCT